MEERFIRQLPFIGAAVQRAIRDLTLGVVGVSGTGSHLVLLAALLGVRKFILVDPAEKIAEKHRNRMAFASAEFLGQPKVAAAAAWLKRWDPAILCLAIQQRFPSPETEVALEAADVICDCTDDVNTDLDLGEFSARRGKVLLLLKQGGTAGSWGSAAALAAPGGPCLRHLYLGEGALPASEGSIGISASAAAAMGLSLLLGHLRGDAGGFNLSIFDGHRVAARALRVLVRPDCPACCGRSGG